MSAEDITTLERIYAEWAQGRFWGFDLFHRDIETRWATEVPDIETAQGVEGLAHLFEEWTGAWGDCRIMAEEYFDAGDRIVVFVLVSGRGSGSTIDVHMRNAHVWTMQDGQARSIRAYSDRQRAMREAGLAE